MSFSQTGRLLNQQCNSSRPLRHHSRHAIDAAGPRVRVLRCTVSSSHAASTASTAVAETAAADVQSFVRPGSQLEQLAAMTVLSIDTGDIQTIEKFAATGLITDATTNPLFGK